MADGPVLLYDGLCGFCDGTVQFILKHDRRGTLRFATLLGLGAQLLLHGFHEFTEGALVPGIDNAAHLGGLLSGAAMATVVQYRRVGERRGLAAAWRVVQRSIAQRNLSSREMPDAGPYASCRSNC